MKGAELQSTAPATPGGRAPRDESDALVELAHVLAHEVRAPLTSVLASAGLLEEVLGDRLGEQERRLLANVREGAARIKERTDELTDFVSLRAGQSILHKGPVDVRAFLSGVWERLRPTVERAGMTLEVQEPPQWPDAMLVDAARVEQVIGGLVDNAVRYAAAGKRITVVVTFDGLLRILVRDFGKGIPREQQQALFQPFAGVARGGRGTGLGLGLPLYRAIIEAHGGKLELQSVEGQGTEVQLLLPI